MSVDDIVALAGRLAEGERLLGLDVGAKTVGLALSNRGLTVASPLETLRRAKLACWPSVRPPSDQSHRPGLVSR